MRTPTSENDLDRTFMSQVTRILERAREMEQALEERVAHLQRREQKPRRDAARLAERQTKMTPTGAAVTVADDPLPTKPPTFRSGSVLFTGSSAFSDFDLLSATGLPSAPASGPITAQVPGLVSVTIATSTASATPTATSAASSSTQSTGQAKNITPYLIAAGSVGGFIITILVIWVVLRCRRRAKRRPADSSAEFTSSPRLQRSFDGMTDAKLAQDAMMHSAPPPAYAFTRTDSDHSLPSSVPSFPAPPPLARSSFIGRERGVSVRASINRHPLATLNEHMFFDSDTANVEHAPRKPSLAQQISYGASTTPHDADAFIFDDRNDSFLDMRESPFDQQRVSMRRGTTFTATSSLSSGFGEGALPPPLPSPEGLAPLKSRRSDIMSMFKLDRVSWAASHPPQTPPSSVRQSAASVVNPHESVPRFRSVNGWVEYQKSRAKQTASDGSDTLGKHETARLSAAVKSSGWPISLNTAGSWDSIPASSTSLKPGKLDIRKRGADGAEAKSAVALKYRASDYQFGGPFADEMAVQPPVPPLNLPASEEKAKAGGTSRVNSTSTATVFRFHPGDEIQLNDSERVPSMLLDQRFGRI